MRQHTFELQFLNYTSSGALFAGLLQGAIPLVTLAVQGMTVQRRALGSQSCADSVPYSSVPFCPLSTPVWNAVMHRNCIRDWPNEDEGLV